MSESISGSSVVNVTDLIDSSPIRGFQIGVFVLCALVALLDGMDTQSIGVAAPFIAENLGIPVTSFGPIFSSALLGAMLGALTFVLIPLPLPALTCDSIAFSCVWIDSICVSACITADWSV